MDEFDHYSEILYGSMKWDNTLSVNCTYYPTYGRRGGGMIALVGTTGTYPEYLYKTLNGNHATIMVGFAVTFQHSTPPPYTDKSFLKLCDGSTDHIYLRLNVLKKYSEVVRAPSTILGTYPNLLAMVSGITLKSVVPSLTLLVQFSYALTKMASD